MADLHQDRFRLDRKLGTGSFGEVWLATDPLLDRPVAIKYLQATRNLIYREQFLTEARALARLKHPNIIAIHDAVFDADDEKFHLIMEYADGKDLATIIKESSPLPLDVVLDIAMDILQALSYAHRQGIVHRDVKPSNVIINGGVKLVDFGLAILKEDTGLWAGSLAYMSPEQTEGRPVDGRADLYSLGVTLFEMISGGQVPFDYNDEDKMLEAHRHASPPPLSKFTPTVPPLLEHTVMRLLAKDPADRYPSADVLMNVLGSIHARLKFDKPHLRLLDPDAKPLVGRNRELEELEAIWEQVRASSQPRLLVVHGDMGVGKTRLVAEFLGKIVVDQGRVALVGRCDEFGVPYTPFAEILATIFSTESLRSVTNEEQREKIIRQVPGLARRLNMPPSTPTEVMLKDPRQSKWRFFETVLKVLAELGPAVVFFEDATHLDEASVALTRYLIQHDRQLPLLIIAACRDSSDGIPCLSAFRADETEVLTLRPLSADATRVLLTNLLDGPVSEAGVSTVHTRSSGIPLYIEVVANLLQEEGEFNRGPTGEWQYKSSMKTRPLSPTLTTLFAQRLGKLSEKSFTALAFAALIDAEFDFDTWLALLGGECELNAALDVLDEALGLRILRETGQNRFLFHPIDIAQVLTASLTPPRRRHFHPRIAQILSEQRGDPALIAHHYEKADLAPEAARYREAAGAKAMTANAVNQAISHYERAVELDASQESFEALGNLYHQHGASAESIDAYVKALELARDAKDTTSQSRILNNLSFVHCMYDHYSDAHQTASAVLELPDISEVERAVAQSNLGFISWSIGRLIEAEEWCLMAVDILEKHGDEVSLATVCSRLGLAHFSRGKFPEAKAAFERSLEIRRRQGFYWDRAYCLNNLAKVAIEQGDFEGAESLLNSAKQLFEEIENPDGLATVYRNQGRALLRQGKAIEALSVLVEALELVREIGKERSPGGLNDVYLLIAEANAELGDLKWAKDALAQVDTAGNQEFAARAQGLSAQILAAQGDHSDAQAMFKKAIAMFEQVGHPAGLLRTKISYAKCLAAQGWTHSAAAEEKEARDEAGRIGLYL